MGLLLLTSDFIWDFRKLPIPSNLGKYFIKMWKISAKIHEIGKIKVIFGLGMTPIYGLKNSQIKSLLTIHIGQHLIHSKLHKLLCLKKIVFHHFVERWPNLNGGYGIKLTVYVLKI